MWISHFQWDSLWYDMVWFKQMKNDSVTSVFAYKRIHMPSVTGTCVFVLTNVEEIHFPVKEIKNFFVSEWDNKQGSIDSSLRPNLSHHPPWILLRTMPGLLPIRPLAWRFTMPRAETKRSFLQPKFRFQQWLHRGFLYLLLHIQFRRKLMSQWLRGSVKWQRHSLNSTMFTRYMITATIFLWTCQISTIQ